MARRKKKSEATADDADKTAGPGHNKPELTEDERRVLLYQHKIAWQKADQAVEAAKAERKRVEELAKAEYGKSAVRDLKDLILLESPKGEEALRSDIERQLRLARWANASVGTQFHFDAFDGTPATDKAREVGKTAGLKGEPCKPPHDPSVPQHQAWINGWHEGQAVLLSDFRSKMEGGGQQMDLAERKDVDQGTETDGLVMAEPPAPPTEPSMSDPPFAVPADDGLDIPANLRREPAAV